MAKNHLRHIVYAILNFQIFIQSSSLTNIPFSHKGSGGNRVLILFMFERTHVLRRPQQNLPHLHPNCNHDDKETAQARRASPLSLLLPTPESFMNCSVLPNPPHLFIILIAGVGHHRHNYL